MLVEAGGAGAQPGEVAPAGSWRPQAAMLPAPVSRSWCGLGARGGVGDELAVLGG